MFCCPGYNKCLSTASLTFEKRIYYWCFQYITFTRTWYCWWLVSEMSLNAFNQHWRLNILFRIFKFILHILFNIYLLHYLDVGPVRTLATFTNLFYYQAGPATLTASSRSLLILRNCTSAYLDHRDSAHHSITLHSSFCLVRISRIKVDFISK